MFGLCLCQRSKNVLAQDKNSSTSFSTAQRKWNTVFDINSNEWKQIYILPFKATACTKLHWFQFRINHNILATNYFLKKIKIIFSSDICLYIYSILCLVKWHCIHHLYILYQHPQKLESSLKMFGFYYAIVYFIVYSLQDN
jgi:hypothetical protein